MRAMQPAGEASLSAQVHARAKLSQTGCTVSLAIMGIDSEMGNEPWCLATFLQHWGLRLM